MLASIIYYTDDHTLNIHYLHVHVFMVDYIVQLTRNKINKLSN